MRQPAVILVVEDELSVQEMLSVILTSAGFAVRRALTVAEALIILETDHIDAMTLDVHLPDPEGLDRSGLALLSYVRATPAYATLPVIVLTGALSFAEADLAARHGACVLYKPQPYAVIIARLREFLADAPPAAPSAPLAA